VAYIVQATHDATGMRRDHSDHVEEGGQSMTMSRVVCGVTLMSMLVLRVPRTATACAIDNSASLHADTVPAMLTTSLPHGPGPWAPFTITQAIASEAPVQFTEAQADLARTLPAAMRRAPYRWAFGDGTVALGHDVTHRYAHPGRYIVPVCGYDRRARGWFTFDQALVHVVPPDQVLRANLGLSGPAGCHRSQE